MSLREMLTGRLYTAQQVKEITEGKKPLKNRLDGANDGKEMNVTLDKMVAIAAMADVRTKAAYAIQTWAETDDLDKDESLYDRLDALISAIADGGIDLDGDASTDDTDDVYMVALQAASDYMSALGADDSDLETLFNSKDDGARDEAANRLLEFLMQALGDDDSEAEEAVKNFAFDMDSDGNVFDSANFKKMPVIRGGKKIILKKRLGTKLKRTPKQKAALMKAQHKAHSGAANLHRQKSLKVGHKAGLY
jgi:homogentisate 1,2-dioxygenase